MVGARGFEPPTPDTPCQCATRLRYAPKIPWNEGVMEYWNTGLKILDFKLKIQFEIH